jgi:hypothetical protein
MSNKNERGRTTLTRLGVLTVIALAVFGGFQAGAATVTPRAQFGNDKVVRSANFTVIPVQPLTDVTVVSVTLPIGHWVVQSEATAQGLNDIADVVRCFIVAPGVRVGHATEVGNASGYPIVGQLSSTVGLNLTASTLVRLRCNHDNNTGDAYGIDLDASLWAHRA